MKELVLVPSYKREALLYSTLKRIREVEPKIPIAVFPDRGTYHWIANIAEHFGASCPYVPQHDYYGNSYCTLEAYRYAYNSNVDHTYLIEDDVFVHDDFFKWHRQMHHQFDDIFAAMGWVFNQHAPIDEGLMFQPWFYSIGVSFTRAKLELIVEHASPKYYGDMAGYIREQFPASPYNGPFQVAHVEQDGLIQRILEKHKMQTVSCGIAKCSHLGMGGYNRGWINYSKFFGDEKDLEKCDQKLRALLADPYWRISIFGRGIVEREVGRQLPKRNLHYRVSFDGWESEFDSEMSRANLPSRINSAEIPDHAELVLES